MKETKLQNILAKFFDSCTKIEKRFIKTKQYEKKQKAQNKMYNFLEIILFIKFIFNVPEYAPHLVLHSISALHNTHHQTHPIPHLSPLQNLLFLVMKILYEFFYQNIMSQNPDHIMEEIIYPQRRENVVKTQKIKWLLARYNQMPNKVA